ncbi:MAG: glycoside hydrolase family 2 [Tannerella sp.]|jgi:beta-mannosidase|nr:glycoside hydrolase family 2 [Tannerella sp.]
MKYRTSIGLWILLFASSTAGGQSVSLNGTWDLSFWEQPAVPLRSPEALQQTEHRTIPATVPGNVELDLLAAGLIHDPMIGSNVWEMRPYEGYQWCYSRTFPTPALAAGQRADLRFGGIDCLADIWLNGAKVGEAENMLIEHTFDVTGLLKSDGQNTLQVILRSAVIESQNYLLNVFSGKGGTANHESENIRKAPHGYGWDILPRLVSAGLWRDVELQIVEPIHFTDVFWMVHHIDTAHKRAYVRVDYQLHIPFKELDKHQAVVRLKRNGQVVHESSQRLYTHAYGHRFDLENAELWWPRGYGEPALYEAEVEIVDASGRVLAADRRRIGLRTVGLDLTDITTPEQPGEFCFRVNGEKIFIKGANWVPVDALHSRDASLLRGVLDMAVDLNCNMLRCWGGNVYEDHAFFDFCDENGILVWQDFAMGCSVYPQDDGFAKKIEQEVRSVALKLRNHPSLILWAGNNENDEAIVGSVGIYHPDPNRERISRRTIPELMFELDPTRPYLPSSPYLSPGYYAGGRRHDLLPERHLWGPRGYYKAPFYTEVYNHFVSEIGYHGCPNRESLEKMFTPDNVYPWKKGAFEWNDEWQTKASRYHQYSDITLGRNNLMINQIRELFGQVPTDLDKFIFASQTVQAEAMKYFVEFWRAGKFYRTGILWWNLRDGWPMVSDAVTDYYNGKKMAYYYIRRVQGDACVMIGDARERNHPVVAVNDTRTEKRGTVTVRDLDTRETLFSGKFVIPSNGKTTVGYIPQTPAQGMWLIEYTIDDQKRTNHYLAGQAPFRLQDYERWYKQLSKTVRETDSRVQAL